MRKIMVAIITLGVLGFALPIVGSTSADARHHRGHRVVVIKKHHDRGLHRGWYKNRHHHHRRGARVIVR
jgi:hypothetical protein